MATVQYYAYIDRKEFEDHKPTLWNNLGYYDYILVFFLREMKWTITRKGNAQGSFSNYVHSGSDVDLSQDGNGITFNYNGNNFTLPLNTNMAYTSPAAAAELQYSFLDDYKYTLIGDGSDPENANSQVIKSTFTTPHFLIHLFDGMKHWSTFIREDTKPEMSPTSWVQNYLEPHRETYGRLCPNLFREVQAECHLEYERIIKKASGKGSFIHVAQLNTDATNPWVDFTIPGYDWLGMRIVTNSNTGMSEELRVLDGAPVYTYYATALGVYDNFAGTETTGSQAGAWYDHELLTRGNSNDYLNASGSVNEIDIRHVQYFVRANTGDTSLIHFEKLMLPRGQHVHDVYIKVNQ